MAEVIQCDACKALTKRTDALRIAVQHASDPHYVKPMYRLEVCPRCHRKLQYTLNLGKDVKTNAD